MISKAIKEDHKRRNKNLSIDWIDYQKVFDSIPHSWVKKPKELVGVNSKIFKYCKLSMEHKASFKNKARSNAVTTHSDTKRNIP